MNKLAIYQQRRVELAKLICAKTSGGIAIITTAPEAARNRDSEFPYRHDSDFFYLTGFEEPSATLVLKINGAASAPELESHLFCRPKDAEREIWDGIRLGPDAAPVVLGVEYAHSNHELDKKLGELLADQDAVYIRLSESAETDRRLRHWMKHVRAHARAGVNPPSEFHDVENLIHEMRFLKMCMRSIPCVVPLKFLRVLTFAPCKPASPVCASTILRQNYFMSSATAVLKALHITVLLLVVPTLAFSIIVLVIPNCVVVNSA